MLDLNATYRALKRLGETVILVSRCRGKSGLFLDYPGQRAEELLLKNGYRCLEGSELKSYRDEYNAYTNSKLDSAYVFYEARNP